jgi:hypothetical protein
MNARKILYSLILVLIAGASMNYVHMAAGDSQNLLYSAKESGGFNDCNYQFQDNMIKIFAKSSTDPGVYFQKIDMDVSKYKYFTFAIKGDLIREGQWCFPVVQLYDASDDEYTPSITKTSFSLKDDDFTTISVPLDGKVKTLYKIQFILVTDKGSWDIEVKDPRLE